MIKKRVLLFVIFIYIQTTIKYSNSDDVIEFTSAESRTHLIELFSSEGCSSCPKADAWLSALRENPNLWKQFVPIEFHVDYWNRLGWIDRLSKSIFTDRQNAYANEWLKSSVYTPGFVLDGLEWRPFGNSIPSNGQETDKVGILSARETGKYTFYAKFKPVKALATVRIYGALLGNGLESKVNAGENSGKLLRHEFVVLSLVQQKMKFEKAEYTAVIELIPPLRELAKSFSAALWVTDGQSQKPLQAVGGDLKK